MKKEKKVFIQCLHKSGKIGTFSSRGDKVTKCYKDAFDLFTSTEYKAL